MPSSVCLINSTAARPVIVLRQSVRTAAVPCTRETGRVRDGDVGDVAMRRNTTRYKNIVMPVRKDSVTGLAKCEITIWPCVSTRRLLIYLMIIGDLKTIQKSHDD